MPRSLEEYFRSVITKSKRAEMRSGINSEISKNESIRAGIKFIPPPKPDAKQPNHYFIFCTHEVPYWRTCSKCGRDKHLAARNADLILKHIGGAAFFTNVPTK